MNLISRPSLAEAWLEAAEHLLRQEPHWRDTTVVLHVEDPRRVGRADRAVVDTLDMFLVSHGNHSNHTVAETIFPAYEYARRGASGVFNYPKEIFARIEKHPDSRPWGTYAQRLLHRIDRDGNEYSPLRDLIKKMKQKNPVKASYEISLAFDIAMYDDDVHRTSRMGGPCLSHLSFKMIDKKVHLTAVYRSHYYIHRAYGNLLGLARLQGFVAQQVGIATGPLVCHSTMALLESGTGKQSWSKRDVKSLIRACRAARGSVSERLGEHGLTV